MASSCKEKFKTDAAHLLYVVNHRVLHSTDVTCFMEVQQESDEDVRNKNLQLKLLCVCVVWLGKGACECRVTVGGWSVNIPAGQRLGLE